MPPKKIRPLQVPDAVGSEGWLEFVAFADHVNAIQRETEGERALRRSPEQVLLAQQHQTYLEKPVWVARDAARARQHDTMQVAAGRTRALRRRGPPGVGATGSACSSRSPTCADSSRRDPARG